MTQAVQTAQFGNTNPAWRNRIINGGMTIDQRNAGASITPSTNTWSVDRWKAVFSAASKFSVQQNAGSVTPPVGFKNYLGATSTSSYSLSSSDYFELRQPVEVSNVSDLAWGTINAKPVTLSFWVYSSLTGTFGGSIFEFSNGYPSYPFSYTITSPNTWQYVTITIAGPTSGTWNTTINTGLFTVSFSLGAGSNWTGTANTWANSSFYLAPTGQTSVVGVNGATWYITGVQLEVGTAATNFEFRDYGREMILCQRYYWKTTPSTYNAFAAGVIKNATSVITYVKHPVSMRAGPSFTYSGTVSIGIANGATNISAIAAAYVGLDSSRVDFTVSGQTAGQGAIAYTDSGSASNYVQADSEL